jgi:hypothetical protein
MDAWQQQQQQQHKGGRQGRRGQGSATPAKGRPEQEATHHSDRTSKQAGVQSLLPSMLIAGSTDVAEACSGCMLHDSITPQ